MAIQDGVDMDMNRKTVEGVFGEGRKKIKIFPPSGGNKRAKGENRGETDKVPTTRPGRVRQTEVITVSQEGKSYADMLVAQSIRTIRESRGRKMVIIVEKKEKEALDELKWELSRIQDVSTRVSGGRDTAVVTIKDMDGLTTKEEVEQAVNREVGSTDVGCEIGDLRPYYGANQAVTVKLDRKHAENLIRRGKIKIGLCWCSITEKVNVMQCYRCWQFGHRSANCSEEVDLADACRKCGGTGHKAAQCHNSDRCLSCKQDGHGAGSGKCPLFRQALRRARLNRKKRNNY